MAPMKKKIDNTCMFCNSLCYSFSSFHFPILHHLYFGVPLFSNFLSFFFFVIAVVSFSQRKGPRLASCYWPILYKHNQQINKKRNKQTANILWQDTMMHAPFTYNDSSFSFVCVCLSKFHLDVMEALSAFTLGH